MLRSLSERAARGTQKLINTVKLLINALAFIYFRPIVPPATIRGRRLLEARRVCSQTNNWASILRDIIWIRKAIGLDIQLFRYHDIW